MIRTKAFLERELKRYRDWCDAQAETIVELQAQNVALKSRGDEAVRLLADLERDLHHARLRITEATDA